MPFLSTLSWIAFFHTVIAVSVIWCVAVREDISPEARMAWFMAIILFPVGGYILYYLFGSARVNELTRRRYHNTYQHIYQHYAQHAGIRYLGQSQNLSMIASSYQAPFRYLTSINKLYPVLNNQAELMLDGDSARTRLIQDIDNASQSINVLYYIWLDDHTGKAVAQALIRATQRGVQCRVLVDAIGSRRFLRSTTWKQLQQSGVKTGISLPLSPWWVIFLRRPDLRNHRKITLIDGKITYCGSQNCADEAFAIKAKYAPWVDIMLRLEGPIVTQTQMLFLADWMLATHESPSQITLPLTTIPEKGFPAHIMGGGPTERQYSTSQFLVSLINSAKKTLTISTPYFVPDAAVLEALCTVAWQGVKVTLIFPKRNDSWVVAGVSRCHYNRLLTAGCHIYEYEKGLLHAKTLTIDGKISLIGSTNLDLRSFDLNYENNILLQDEKTTLDILQRQQQYIQDSSPVHHEHVQQWSNWRRIWYNLLATISPIL